VARPEKPAISAPAPAPPTPDRGPIELFFREASTFAGLRDGIRARVEQLSISRSCLDDLTGLPMRYCGKLLSQGEAKDQKRIGALSL
jgi:hypothetical protein